jgi:hypothetical protein
MITDDRLANSMKRETYEWSSSICAVSNEWSIFEAG